MNNDAARQREALRQQLLLRVLWRDSDAGVLKGQARALGTQAPWTSGVAVYRGNGAALAERALAAAYPTLAELIGAESFAALARALWSAHPPQRGDVGTWGGELAAFIAASEQLADEPYLADMARLEWAVHEATRAADAPEAEPDLQALADSDPARLRLVYVPVTALQRSAWPLATIWHAHRRPPDDPERFADVRTAFADQRAETCLVWRDGFVPHVEARNTADAAFDAAVLDGRSLAAALDRAGPDFAFDRWLADALRARRLAAVLSFGVT